MQAVGGREQSRRRASGAPGGGGSGAEEESTGCSMYAEAPTADVALEEFEQLALQRLAVLKGIDDALSRGLRTDDLEKATTTLLVKYQLQVADPGTGRVIPEAVRKDMMSHFILRLVYCRTEELRRWFLTQECALFRHRFKRLTNAARVKFLADNGLKYTALSAEEFATVSGKLFDTAHSQNKAERASEIISAGAGGFYTVPFEEVPELVRSRKVLLRGGRAYVPAEQLGVLVVGAFRAALSRSLALSARRWASHTSAEEAERLAPLVEGLSSAYLGADFGGGSGGDGGGGAALRLADLAPAMEASAPLCMRNLFVHLREEHHLKHAGRMQFGLFLKGAGVSLEDALAFWRAEFCKRITPETFEKQYAYNVRHNYGREGKRQDYTPYSCMKICSATPGAGEHHGCPYRTFSEESLRAALRGMKLAPSAVEAVVDKAKNKHYQLACGMTFAARHGKEMLEGVQHPNSYFLESRRALGLAPAAGAADAAAPPVPAPAAPQPVTPGE